jgi:hypothetical protein
LASLAAPRTLPGVTSADLTPEQAAAMKAQAARRLAWLERLIARMDRLGWQPTDSLYQAALQARAGAHALHVASHYAGIRHGVGKREEGADEDVARRA